MSHPSTNDQTGTVLTRRARLDELSKRIKAVETKIEIHETDEWIKDITNVTGLKLRQEVLAHASDQPLPEAEWDELCDVIDRDCQDLEDRFNARMAALESADPNRADTKKRFNRATRDPAAVFKTPHDVVTDPKLSLRQKLDVLKRWESDARELAVAEEENMTGGEPNRLRETLLAIRELEPAPKEEEKTAPTKHGG